MEVWNSTLRPHGCGNEDPDRPIRLFFSNASNNNGRNALMKVLIVEDDAETATYVVKGLSECGHVVDHVSNGSEGVFAASNGSYDVAIVDRMLPKLDGLSLVRQLRRQGIGTPVLFLTNLGGLDDRVEGLNAGGDDYLVKPFAFSEVLARVNALARRPAIP